VKMESPIFLQTVQMLQAVKLLQQFRSAIIQIILQPLLMIILFRFISVFVLLPVQSPIQSQLTKRRFMVLSSVKMVSILLLFLQMEKRIYGTVIQVQKLRI
jgi:hypothetical protein